jgi:luciferase family oxidoreductase group 1
MPGIASAATAVVIGYIAGGTKTIRVGSGGIMLPNHAPLVIAEQFGTLESLYGGRIDLGLGRAPGTDQRTARALRRDLAATAEKFPHDVMELKALLGPLQPNQAVRAVPGAGSGVPIWLLGSSTFSAQLAAMLGLPFAFASHFAPAELMRALDVYRTRFQPSRQLREPYAMVGVNVFAANTDAEAQRLFTSLQQQFVSLRRGTPGPLPPPVGNMDDHWSPMERAGVGQSLAYSVIGAPDTVERGLQALTAETGADELMLTAQIYDHAARLRSFEIAAEVRDGIAARQPASPARSDVSIA